MFMALSDMQDAYFQHWLGTWPHGIDWTRAVMSTHVAATLRTISDELELDFPNQGAECASRKEEVVAGYFADVIAYYFAEDAFSLRNQAYDDMLWVVLGWLESIQFIDEHGRFLSSKASAGLGSTPGAETWYGSRWIPAFAHRARIFWELAAKGWDKKLCGGGMLWNPRLMPYKNAITNQLFISASIGMYLHFPGDPNASPFGRDADPTPADKHRAAEWGPHDPIFGKAAQEAHRWLTSSNMTNHQGLYADGFHISGHSSGGNNTLCDERDEMVYTYNQGVLLSGLLGLYQATGGGREHYLREGHALIQNVIRATGYDLARNRPVDDGPDAARPIPPWRGLGRLGVLEEACDAAGSCSQDAQTFKGIWMHHFAAFCAPAALRSRTTAPAHPEADAIRDRHAADCRRYVPWLRHNARAALGTRDGRGLFGMWWTAGLLRLAGAEQEIIEAAAEDALPLPEDDGQVVDYRNLGVPLDAVWVREVDIPRPMPSPEGEGQKPLNGGLGGRSRRNETKSTLGSRRVGSDAAGVWDPNLRGRGRTVETQGGGLAVLRALWVVSGHEL
ncbi:glycosyl hydrolase family 76-domain-containing protein [Chaetomium sp. MPI-CAGE-AT-0009]|nr:glycosyl hydrolase family 76-domain-containing protein [Chaetomium sp. MPI-CAGE-AT-0009]